MTAPLDLLVKYLTKVGKVKVYQCEEAWAVGPTPEVALFSATREWATETDNPSREALAHFE